MKHIPPSVVTVKELISPKCSDGTASVIIVEEIIDASTTNTINNVICERIGISISQSLYYGAPCVLMK